MVSPTRYPATAEFRALRIVASGDLAGSIIIGARMFIAVWGLVRIGRGLRIVRIMGEILGRLRMWGSVRWVSFGVMIGVRRGRRARRVERA